MAKQAPKPTAAGDSEFAGGEVAMVVVPFPAQGHLNQLLHFCRLVLSTTTTTTTLPVHFAGTATHNLQAKSRLHGWSVASFPSLTFHDLPVDEEQLSDDDLVDPTSTKFPAHLLPTVDLRPHVAALLRRLSLSFRRVVVVHDSLMSFAAHEAAAVGNCESYAFHSVSAFANLLFQWERRGVLDDEWRKLNLFPGRRKALTSEGCFTEAFLEFVRRQHGLSESPATLEGDNGRIINTCFPIEGKFIEMFRKEPILRNKPLFAVGPLNPLIGGDEGREEDVHRHECLRWLDKQPPASVLYVSFGTTSEMSPVQIEELAGGLERSRQSFIWVLRGADKGDVFLNSGEPLPSRRRRRWRESTHRREGLLCEGGPRSWRYSATWRRRFMSHCGWNSCMESMSHGVPVAAWPMHSDQPRNAAMLAEVLGVAIEVREWARRDEIVHEGTIERAIRRLMSRTGEGEEVRIRAKRLGEGVRRCIRAEDGSSRMAMESFVSHITRP